MTKDMKKVFLDIPNSYNPSKKASIDFYLAKTISLLYKKEGYGELEYDRRWMSENLTKAIVQSVCKYLEDKHIATFDFR